MPGGRRTWWTADPFQTAVDRPTGLLGILWATGGLLTLLWAAVEVRLPGSQFNVALLGVGASALGAVLLLLHRRRYSRGLYAALTLLGSLVITAILFWSGPEATGAPSILFVYVGLFSAIALGRGAWVVIVLTAAIHAGVLALHPGPGGPGEWVMVWGAIVVASALTGTAVAANRRSAEQREQLLEELRRADETKTAFVRVVGHDLSAPAANVVGMARTVLDHDAELGEQRRRHLLERLLVNAVRLHGDLDALLRMEEMNTGQITIHREEVALDDLISGAVVRAGVDPARVERRDTRGVVVAVDEVRFEHALANLLSNAQKYGGAGPIVVGSYLEEDRRIIHVDDDGPGVPEAARGSIFEPLRRARSQDTDRGSGIGLTVVRAFARFHEGECWVEDAPGGGARFCISLPRASMGRD